MLKYFSKTQLFMAFCAMLMCAETYFMTGIAIDFVIPATVFFATLFIYNAAMLKLVMNDSGDGSKYSVTISGDNRHVVLCSLSLIMVFAGLAASHYFNIIIFILTALLSVFYMMPFTKNGQPLKGLRNNIVMKNIVLSVVWASATVLFPIASGDNMLPANDILFMFLRRFFFIYALTVVYDVRDIEQDTRVNMKTLAVRFGDSGARNIAMISLLFFVLCIAIDPALNVGKTNSVAVALYISAFITAIIIAGTKSNRGAYYYSYIIDGSMLVQFVLVAIFVARWY